MCLTEKLTLIFSATFHVRDVVANCEKPMKLLIPILFLLTLIISCKSNSGIKRYTLDRQLQVCDSCEIKVWTAINAKKYITLTKDSILNLTAIYGHMGSSAKVKYKIKNDLLITDTVDINGNKPNSDFKHKNKFKFSNDSLVDISTGEVYHSDDYIKRKNPNGFKPFYIVIRNKKNKVSTIREAKRIIRSIDNSNKLVKLNIDSAKTKYGINEKYNTYIVRE